MSNHNVNGVDRAAELAASLDAARQNAGATIAVLKEFGQAAGLSAQLKPFGREGSLAERLASNPFLMAPMAGVTDSACTAHAAKLAINAKKMLFFIRLTVLFRQAATGEVYTFPKKRLQLYTESAHLQMKKTKSFWVGDLPEDPEIPECPENPESGSPLKETTGAIACECARAKRHGTVHEHGLHALAEGMR